MHERTRSAFGFQIGRKENNILSKVCFQGNKHQMYACHCVTMYLLGGNCETFKNWNFNNSGITYLVLTRSDFFEKVLRLKNRQERTGSRLRLAFSWIHLLTKNNSHNCGSVTEIYSSSLRGWGGSCLAVCILWEFQITLICPPLN